MRVLHSTLQSRPSVGVVRQMDWESSAAIKLGLHWDVELCCPGDVGLDGVVLSKSKCVFLKKEDGFFRSFFKSLRLRNNYYYSLYKSMEYYDVIVLRYLPFELHQLIFILFCRKPVCLIHHTQELLELKSRSSFVNSLKILIESIVAPLCIRKSKYIVGVTDEILRYEFSRAKLEDAIGYVYPNGIGFESGPVADKRGDSIQLLFLASYFYEWHGVDLLLQAMAESDDCFVLHLVGTLNSEDQLRANRDNRVVCHGLLSEAEVKKLAQSCWLGLSSFALHRKGMHEACTLKVREYLQMGLPVYSGHTDVFPVGFDFYQKGECNIASLLECAKNHRFTDRDVVSEVSRPFIDKVSMLDDFYRFIDESK